MQNSYTITKTLLITKQVLIISPKEFVIAILDMDNKIFVMHIAIKEQEQILVYPNKEAQIKTQNQSKAQSRGHVATLLSDKVAIAILVEYSDYSNDFLAENATKLSKHSGISDYTIKLEKSKHPAFSPIYSSELVEVEILKILYQDQLG